MTREETIKRFQRMKKILSIPNSDAAKTIEAIDMAIEALSEGNIARDIATILENEQDMRVILNLVRCKDCRWWNCKNLNYQHNNHLCRYWSKFGSIDTSADDFCSYGERG